VIASMLNTLGFNAAPMFIPMNAEVRLKQGKEDGATNVFAFGWFLLKQTHTKMNV